MIYRDNPGDIHIITACRRVKSNVSQQFNMRTGEEFRARRLEQLARELRRPSFVTGGDWVLGDMLRDLFWVEERPDRDWQCVSLLLGRTSLRVYGQFHFQDKQNPDYYRNEVASTYAEAAYRLGYFEPARLLSIREYEALNDSLNTQFFDADHTQAEIVALLGPPSHDVLGGQTTVHCYGCFDATKPWVYFDYSRCLPPDDGVTYDYFNDEMLRDVRRNENKFELLPFAEWFHGNASG